jgi:hypothetical protein
LSCRAGAGEKESKILLFLKKKKQKDFFPLVPNSQLGRSHPPRSALKSLFGSFSSEKEHLPLGLMPRV